MTFNVTLNCKSIINTFNNKQSSLKTSTKAVITDTILKNKIFYTKNLPRKSLSRH